MDMVEIWVRNPDAEELVLLDAREFDSRTDPPGSCQRDGLLYFAIQTTKFTRADGGFLYSVVMIEVA